MARVAKHSADVIVGRGLIAAETMAQELRDRLVSRIARQRRKLPSFRLLDEARLVLSEFEPVLAQTLEDTMLAGMIRGMDVVQKRLPSSIWAAEGPSVAEFSPFRGQPPSLFPLEPAEAQITFPKIDEAISQLFGKEIVTRPQFDAMSDQARRNAFTIANVQSLETVDKVRDTLAELIEEGTSLREFRNRIAETLQASPIGPARLETIYRTNTLQAFAQGQETIANNPAVRAAFPYARYHAIDDGRVRDEHLQLEKLGLNGTNVYRADDPMWAIFTPPWDFNCFVPDTNVSGQCEVASRMRYEGDVIEITTVNGARLTVTPNHPILTDEGMIPARMLHNGAQVVRYVENGRDLDAEHEHVHEAPLRIQDVFEAFSLHSPLTRVPARSNYFHGDGALGKSEIDVVAPDNELLNTANKEIRNLGLESVNLREVSKGRLSRLYHFFRRPNSTPTSSPSSRQLLLDVLATSACPLYDLRSRLPSDLRSRFDQDTIDNISRYTEFQSERSTGTPLSVRGDDHFCRQSCNRVAARRENYPGVSKTLADAALRNSSLCCDNPDRLAASVLLDQVCKISKRYYSGHVYDLQTPQHVIIANSIITSNCRCTKTFITVRQAANAGVREARAWRRTGQPPTEPEFRLQAIPFRPTSGFTGPGTTRLSVMVKESAYVIRMARAPKGGITINGKDYRGGEFIPGKELEKATPEQRRQIEGEKKQSFPAITDPKEWLKKAQAHADAGEPRLAKRMLTMARKHGADPKKIAAILKQIGVMPPKTKKKKTPTKDKKPKTKADEFVAKALEAAKSQKPRLAKRFVTLARKWGATDEQLKLVLKTLGTHRPTPKKTPPPKRTPPRGKRSAIKYPGQTQAGKLAAKRISEAVTAREVEDALKRHPVVKYHNVDLGNADLTSAKAIGSSILRFFDTTDPNVASGVSTIEIKKMTSRTYGRAWGYMWGQTEIFLNSRHVSNGRRLASSLKSDQATGWCAVGTIEGVMTHELGHAVYTRLKGKDSSFESRVRRGFPPKASELSRYGTTNDHEYFAESYAAITHLPKSKWSDDNIRVARLIKRTFEEQGWQVPPHLKSIPKPQVLVAA